MSRESFDERQYRLELLDAYGSLLTQKHQEIYEFIYGDDLSLSEEEYKQFIENIF